MPTPTALRDAVEDLHQLAAADLRSLWRQVTTADEAREALFDTLPLLVRTYGAAASTVAADWYDESRFELDIPGSFRAIPSDLANQGTDALARWGIGPLFGDEPDWARAATMVDGGLQRRIANAARDTITLTTVEDPRADGWQRVGSGECAFCTMLIARGAVYSERTADFASHDSCRCFAVPAFRGQPRPVQPYTPTSRRVTDADRARVRDYLRTHHAG